LGIGHVTLIETFASLNLFAFSFDLKLSARLSSVLAAGALADLR